MLNWTVCGLSCAFKNIKTPISLLGATTNAAIGFLLPITYYLKMEHKQPKFSNMKIACYIIFVLMTMTSIIELVTIVIQIANGNA